MATYVPPWNCWWDEALHVSVKDGNCKLVSLSEAYIATIGAIYQLAGAPCSGFGDRQRLSEPQDGVDFRREGIAL